MANLSEISSRPFSYDGEKRYYSQHWPDAAKPYLHLEQYLRCWLDPEEMFQGKRVLDIGAGELTYTRLIADRFQPKHIVGCELFCQRMLPAHRENTNRILEAVCGNCYRLPFRDASFDVAVASLVLSQLPELQNVIREISRVLKPGGIFIGWEPNPYNPIILYRYLATPRSPNQFMFWPKKYLPLFEAEGLSTSARFFYAKLPWTRNRFLGTCIGIVAKLQDRHAHG